MAKAGPGRPPILALLVATRGEAAGLIKHYGLTPHRPAAGLTIFGNHDIRLGICGQGASRARQFALRKGRWLAASGESARALWVNFGTAGSADYGRGTLVCGARIVAAGCGPGSPFTLAPVGGIPQATVHTVAAPQARYAPGRVYDMEAAAIVAGLHEAIARPEIRVIKLITDGPEKPVHEVGRNEVVALLAAAGEELVQLLEMMRAPNKSS